MAENYDILVLGGGPGGYVAAIRAAQLGFKTAVVEKDNLGGICLNWGCIPTKALIKNAEVLDTIKNASQFGIEVQNFSVDFSKIIKRSRDVSDRISKNVEFLMKKNKIERIRGYGKISPKEGKLFRIKIDQEGHELEVEASRLIIATGAHHRIIPSIPVDRKKILTSTEAMNLDKQPDSLAIIGAGAIGAEFAYFYNTLGTKVILIEVMENILPLEDEEISQALATEFRKKGIQIHTSTRVESSEILEDKVRLNITDGNGNSSIEADMVLSAIGVTGNIEGYGLAELGVETERGFIKVNQNDYSTNIQGVFAIGDVIGPPLLAHVASAEAIHCVEAIKGLQPSKINYNSIPACTYCQPQVASIGFTEKKAREMGYAVKVGKFPFMASGKAFAAAEREGFVKMIFDEKYGELLGVHIIGAEATELIAEASLAKSLEATFKTIVKTVHSHPTLSESIMEAAAAAYGEAIHI